MLEVLFRIPEEALEEMEGIWRVDAIMNKRMVSFRLGA